MVGLPFSWNGLLTLLLDGLTPNLFDPWLSLGSNFFGWNATAGLVFLFLFAKLSLSSSTSIQLLARNSASWNIASLWSINSSLNLDSCYKPFQRVDKADWCDTLGNFWSTSLNFVMKVQSDSFGPCEKFQRSVSEVLFPMRIEYCLRT